MNDYLTDVVVMVALVFTLAFAATAFLGMDIAAAWLAFGLALTGAARLAVIVIKAVSDDY
jgi:hypothetical protein